MMDEISLESYLSPGEMLLWSGAPKKKYRIERKHWPMLFILIPFFAFMVFPLVGIFSSDQSGQAGTESSPTAQANPAASSSSTQPPSKPLTLAGKIALSLFILLFVGGMVAWSLYCMGFTVGGNAFLDGKTIYGITKHRLIVVAGKKQKTVRSVHLGSAADLRMKEWPDGLGSISVGAEPVWPYATSLRGSNTILENIAEPRKVFQIIIEARKSA